MGTITVTNLGKAYRKYPNRWSRLAEWIDPFSHTRHSQHWVLQDIHFQVSSGEAVGILGVNGAGKSTLLKMITGTTQPTAGRVEIVGRIAALLELGMGFHPDFTGRQNVVMSGQLLGFTVEQIHQLMPEIEAFANIGDYIDQPVRMYSSGMQMRLAFSVATARRPEVLIVDEALAVGDAAFQRKCFQRIESFREAGTTLLLVSHDIETIKKLCDRALFIKDGRVAEWGPAKAVCDEYERFLFGSGKKNKTRSTDDGKQPKIEETKYDPGLKVESEMVYGNGSADIESSWLTDLNGNRINIIESCIPFKFNYRVHFNQKIISPTFAMMLKTREGVSIYGVDSTNLKHSIVEYDSGDLVDVAFTLENPLAPGIYYFNCGVKAQGTEGQEFLARRVDTAILRVSSGDESTSMAGLIEMKASLETTGKDP